MAMQELQPDLKQIYIVIMQRRDAVPQDPNSTTVQLLNTSWFSQDNQIADTGRRLVKPFSIGDKLIEEAVELAQSEAKGPDSIVEESAQAIYYMMVGIVSKGISLRRLLRSIDQVSTEQTSFIVVPDQVASEAAAAVGRVALAGAKGNQRLLLQRTAEAMTRISILCEVNDIPLSEVGREI